MKKILSLVVIMLISIVYREYIISFISHLNDPLLNDNNINLSILENNNNLLKDEVSNFNNLVLDNIEYEYFISKIALRSNKDYYDQMIIYGGLNQGIKSKMAVIDDKGLIGYISKTLNDYSYVTLISSNKVNIAITINNQYGIINGYKNNMLIARNITKPNNINIGDKVYTSSYSFLPDMLYIGDVSFIDSNEAFTEDIININHRQLNNIKYVAIVKYLKDIS